MEIKYLLLNVLVSFITSAFFTMKWINKYEKIRDIQDKDFVKNITDEAIKIIQHKLE